MKLCFYILSILLCLSTVVKSDIPVHCLKSQVMILCNFSDSREMEIFFNPSRKKKLIRKISLHVWTF